jgi:hypothetical protein
MAKLKLTSTTNIFGTTVKLEGKNVPAITIGEGLEYDPVKKLKKTMPDGYLFRSPNLDPDNLNEIWPTVGRFSGDATLWVEHTPAKVDKKATTPSEDHGKFTGFARIADQSDAALFAYTHSLFEKWSDALEEEAQAEAKKKQESRIKVDKDGKITMDVEVVTLRDEDPE